MSCGATMYMDGVGFCSSETVIAVVDFRGNEIVNSPKLSLVLDIPRDSHAGTHCCETHEIVKLLIH
jgi:hypothetical protein